MAGFGWCGCQNGCMELDIPVPLLVGGTTSVVTTTMYGKLCVPNFGTPSTVVVMIPGATNNSRYFDFTYKPESYNMARAIRNAGFSTLLLDRLGTGRSGKPRSRQVTTTAHAAAVHSIVIMLRGGEIGGAHFSKIILYGHSIGSSISILEASSYRDVDGIIITGMTHAGAAEPIIQAGYSIYQPAATDTSLMANDYDDGYLTRNTEMSGPNNPDPMVKETDDANKDVVSTSETDGFPLTMVASYSKLVDAPVLVVNGQDDALMCSDVTGADCSSSEAFSAYEAPFYSRSPSFTGHIIVGGSHDVSLDATAGELHEVVIEWLGEHG